MRSPRRSRHLVSLALAVVPLAACRSPDHALDARAGELRPANAVVERVIDGDTVVVRVTGREQTVRLLGLDTPESVARSRPVECYGAEAADFLRSLLPTDTRVQLERDVEARDRFGRLLAYLYRADDGLFVNRTLVELGYADVLSIHPNTAHRAELSSALATAQARQLGLWGTCGSADVALGDGPG